jgi:hypothetical protein
VPAVVASSTSVNTSTLRPEGPLSNLAGSCPAVTFTVDNTTVSTTPNTRFTGGTCAQLTDGTTVAVDGTLQNGALVAADVRTQTSMAHVHGTVSALEGACPAVTFTVDNTTVSTTPNTRFTGGTCAQLTDGTAVAVDGTLQDGSVVAAGVEIGG